MRRRTQFIKDAGCIVAHKRGLPWTPCEEHHLLLDGKHGSKRRGDDFTVGLNPWSHRGQPFNGMSVLTCEALFGPSLAVEPVAFRAMWSDILSQADEAMLAFQNQILLDYHRRHCMPWEAPPC